MTSKIPQSGILYKIRASAVTFVVLLLIKIYAEDSQVPSCIQWRGQYGSQIMMCGLQAQLFIGVVGLLAAYLWYLILSPRK